MLRFTPQPAQKGAFQQFGIKPISLRSAMLSRDCNARRMNDVGFNASSRSQRANQKLGTSHGDF